ncbi:hypothetical protein [Massilia rubra]|uniref:Uncharacterized protein n=1 Tax=Massilia rubra TaxID=2607910 RepID=A0ABX0M1Z9_9BURK|nr:hypothetical protein [Massilia rubra]NHZ38357.1 hypothetical protein [Massilia rubra]
MDQKQKRNRKNASCAKNKNYSLLEKAQQSLLKYVSQRKKISFFFRRITFPACGREILAV